MSRRHNKADLFVNTSEDFAELGDAFRAIPFDENWESSVTMVEHQDKHSHPALRIEKSRTIQWHTGRKAIESVFLRLHESFADTEPEA